MKSPRARNKIRQWFSRERREDALETGRDLLPEPLRKQSLPVVRLATDDADDAGRGGSEVPDLDALYVAIGEGHVSPQSVVARLSRLVSEEAGRRAPRRSRAARPVKLGAAGRPSRGGAGVAATCGSSLARCCTPVPGDEIIGFVTRGQGVCVHRADCPNVRRLAAEPERLIEVSWRAGAPTSFVVAIQVEALDRQKLLARRRDRAGDQHVNILSATSHTGKDRIATLRFTFELADITHLSSILPAVKRVDGVFDAYRVVRPAASVRLLAPARVPRRGPGRRGDGRGDRARVS